jgi:hypothetical protein
MTDQCGPVPTDEHNVNDPACDYSEDRLPQSSVFDQPTEVRRLAASVVRGLANEDHRIAFQSQVWLMKRADQIEGATGPSPAGDEQLALTAGQRAATSALVENAGMHDAIRQAVTEHTALLEMPEDLDSYFWCACGWRSDDWSDSEGAARAVVTHLGNEIHEAVRVQWRASFASLQSTWADLRSTEVTR